MGDVLCVTRDVLAPRHYRDFRTTRLPPLDEMIKIQSIRIVEVNEYIATTRVRNFTISDIHDEATPLYFFPIRFHTGRPHPDVLTGIQLWEEWSSQAERILEITLM